VQVLRAPAIVLSLVLVRCRSRSVDPVPTLPRASFSDKW
jgi:hypothetical protein